MADNDVPHAWQLRAGQKLRMVNEIDDSVIFNDCSGETHLVSAIAVSLLEQLRTRPADFLTISTALEKTWEFDSRKELQHTVHELLGELEELGLIQAWRT